MDTDQHGLKHSTLTERIIGVFFDVYNELGSGFLESIYVEALALALNQAGLSVEREMPLAVSFRGRIIGRFRADLVIGGSVLVEAKACSRLHSRHEAQVLNYLPRNCSGSGNASELRTSTAIQTAFVRQPSQEPPQTRLRSE